MVGVDGFGGAASLMTCLGSVGTFASSLGDGDGGRLAVGVESSITAGAGAFAFDFVSFSFFVFFFRLTIASCAGSSSVSLIGSSVFLFYSSMILRLGSDRCATNFTTTSR